LPDVVAGVDACVVLGLGFCGRASAESVHQPTPTELDVVRLAREGRSNKDIAAGLIVSPRTVQTHLTHIYTKLGLTSRVQLMQEAARRAQSLRGIVEAIREQRKTDE
jgi:DNA-binding CsgD family transcriptional regulator